MIRFRLGLLRYSTAMLCTAAALGARWALDPWLGASQPLSLIFAAVALAVWTGGWGPAVAATLVGFAASDYFFIEPRGMSGLTSPAQLIGALTYLMSCACIILFGEGMRRARERARCYSSSLESKQRQLEAAEQRKDEFLATLAHELRNLLAPLQNAVDVLAMAAPSDTKVIQMRGFIGRQVTHMFRLVDDLLDVSRIVAGRMTLEKASLDLRDALLTSLEAIQPRGRTADHALHVSIAAQPLYIMGDQTRLTQVFFNLLGNAHRYTPQGGNIHVTAARDANCAIVSIRDDGIGISPEKLPS